MNFKPDPQRFAAENAPADVMMIRHFMEHKLEIEQMATEGKSPCRRVKLLTNDEGGMHLAQYFEPASLHFNSGNDMHETRLIANVRFLELFTDLAIDRQKRSSVSQHGKDHEPDEYQAVCSMIFDEANNVD